jgi:hypothetical protein
MVRRRRRPTAAHDELTLTPACLPHLRWLLPSNLPPLSTMLARATAAPRAWPWPTGCLPPPRAAMSRCYTTPSSNPPPPHVDLQTPSPSKASGVGDPGSKLRQDEEQGMQAHLVAVGRYFYDVMHRTHAATPDILVGVSLLKASRPLIRLLVINHNIYELKTS